MQEAQPKESSVLAPEASSSLRAKELENIQSFIAVIETQFLT